MDFKKYIYILFTFITSISVNLKAMISTSASFHFSLVRDHKLQSKNN